MKSYTFVDKDTFSKKGVDITRIYLENLSETVSVENVEGDDYYRQIDVDLIQHTNNGDVLIEVKTDNYATGNFFFETISNKSKNTLGCFQKSKAKYLYYYFVKFQKLYIIPLSEVRIWFNENIDLFEEKETSTKSEHGKFSHITVGRLVKISAVEKAFPDLKIITTY